MRVGLSGRSWSWKDLSIRIVKRKRRTIADVRNEHGQPSHRHDGEIVPEEDG